MLLVENQFFLRHRQLAFCDDSLECYQGLRGANKLLSTLHSLRSSLEITVILASYVQRDVGHSTDIVPIAVSRSTQL